VRAVGERQPYLQYFCKIYYDSDMAVREQLNSIHGRGIIAPAFLLRYNMYMPANFLHPDLVVVPLIFFLALIPLNAVYGNNF